MKWKTLIVIAAFIALGVATAFAALNTTIDATYTFSDPNGTATTIIFQPSTKVTVGINSGNDMYAANAKHYDGDRIYGAASNDSKLYWTSSTTATTLSGSPSTTGVDAFSGYNTL